MRILVLTLMMSFLSHSAFGSEGRAIASVLASLEAVEAEVEGGGAAIAIPHLVALLKNGVPQVREKAAGVLWTLAVNADNKVIIAGEANAITNLVSLLRDDSPQVRKNASGALLKLSFIRSYWS